MSNFSKESNSINGFLKWEEMMHYNFWGYDEVNVWLYPYCKLVIDDDRSFEYEDEIVWHYDVWNLMDIKETPN